MNKGFRPCKRCRPDLLSYNPNNELMINIKKFIDAHYNESIDIENLVKNLGISRSHLSKIFKEMEKISIVEYIIKTRIINSLELLKNKNLKIIDIAYTVGFNSLSNYYKCFKNETNLTPKKFRDLEN